MNRDQSPMAGVLLMLGSNFAHLTKHVEHESDRSKVMRKRRGYEEAKASQRDLKLFHSQFKPRCSWKTSRTVPHRLGLGGHVHNTDVIQRHPWPELKLSVSRGRNQHSDPSVFKMSVLLWHPVTVALGVPLSITVTRHQPMQLLLQLNFQDLIFKGNSG